MRKRSDAYIMIDLETSGTRLGYHDLIQFGAVALWGKDFEHRQAFPVWQPAAGVPVNMVQPWLLNAPDPEAMKVNGLNWEQVLAHGEPHQQFCERFRDWVVAVKAAAGADKAVMTGHGVAFDWSFLRLLYNHHRTDWPCHYTPLDFKSFYGGARGLEYLDSSLTAMREEFGVGENRKAHDAQADAEYQADFFVMSWRKLGMLG